MDDDDDEELVEDKSTAPPPQTQPAALVPPASGEEAYWDKVAMMFEYNNKEQENILTDKLMALNVAMDQETAAKFVKIETKLDHNIDEVNKSVASVADMLTALGMKH